MADKASGNTLVTDDAESEKARWRVGIANRKVFARPESFCAYIQIGPKIK